MVVQLTTRTNLSPSYIPTEEEIDSGPWYQYTMWVIMHSYKLHV